MAGKAACADKLMDGETDRVLVRLFHGGGWNERVVECAVPNSGGMTVWVIFFLMDPDKEIAATHETCAEDAGGCGEPGVLFHLRDGLMHVFPCF